MTGIFLWPALGVVVALGAGFAAGRVSREAPAAAARPGGAPLATRAQFGGPSAQNDPRELIPLTPQPGNTPGQGGQPGQGQGSRGSQAPGADQCNVLLFKDGRLYRMQPGTGGEGGRGAPGGDGEVFPLQPADPGGGAAPAPTPEAPVRPDPDLRV